MLQKLKAKQNLSESVFTRKNVKPFDFQTSSNIAKERRQNWIILTFQIE